MSDRLPVLDDELAVLLRRISVQLEELPARIAAELRGAPVDSATVTMIRAIWSSVADRVFTAGDLVEYAALPAAKELKAAILAAVGALNAKRIGKALRRVEGLDVGGLIVRRVGEDRSGILWTVNAGLRV